MTNDRNKRPCFVAWNCSTDNHIRMDSFVSGIANLRHQAQRYLFIRPIYFISNYFSWLNWYFCSTLVSNSDQTHSWLNKAKHLKRPKPIKRKLEPSLFPLGSLNSRSTFFFFFPFSGFFPFKGHFYIKAMQHKGLVNHKGSADCWVLLSSPIKWPALVFYYLGMRLNISYCPDLTVCCRDVVSVCVVSISLSDDSTYIRCAE